MFDFAGRDTFLVHPSASPPLDYILRFTLTWGSRLTASLPPPFPHSVWIALHFRNSISIVLSHFRTRGRKAIECLCEGSYMAIDHPQCPPYLLCYIILLYVGDEDVVGWSYILRVAKGKQNPQWWPSLPNNNNSNIIIWYWKKEFNSISVQRLTTTDQTLLDG